MTNKKAVMALAVSIFVSGSALAATDGELGSNSTGDLDISLSIGDENEGGGSILIQRLDDLDLGEFDASNASALGKGTDFCVYRTGAPSGFDYNIEITSTNGTVNNAFQLLSQTTSQRIGYSVFYSGAVGANTESGELTHGATNSVKAEDGVSLSDDDGTFSCDDDNVSLYVRASVSDASIAIAAADYNDKLTLVVTPE